MNGNSFDIGSIEVTWCPGCGNFPILDTLKTTYSGMGLDPADLVVVSGIGQAGKTPHYHRCHMFNGLHGRAVPVATAVKAANPELTVIAQGGDGDMYGEGGNHFIHAIRRNPDITAVVHNNMVYGLTKGQASPTSQLGFTTPVQVHGVTESPMNSMAVAISLGAAFVGRTFIGDREGMSQVLEAGIRSRGFSLVEIFQPCVTFNRVNTWQWFRDRTEAAPESHDPENRMLALELALAEETLYTGILYTHPGRPTFEETLAPYAESTEPLFARKVNRKELEKVIKEMK